MIEDLNVLWVVRQLHPDEPTQANIPSLLPLTTAQVEDLVNRLANSTAPAPRLELPFELWGALLAREDWQQRLDQLWHRKTSQVESSSSTSNTVNPVNLSQWLENVFEESWQAIERLIGFEPELAFNFRQAQEVTEPVIRRVKRIQLPIQDDGQALLLVLMLKAESDGRMNIRVQLYPILIF